MKERTLSQQIYHVDESGFKNRQQKDENEGANRESVWKKSALASLSRSQSGITEKYTNQLFSTISFTQMYVCIERIYFEFFFTIELFGLL